MGRANIMRAVITTAWLCLPGSDAFAGAPAWRGPNDRIRPQDARAASLLAAGAARSAAFRGLVERIEANRVIVYAGITPLLKSSLAGRLMWMARTAHLRYVRIEISASLSPNQIIATLAHELQHVVEVIDEPAVVDEPSLVELYRRIGLPSRATASAGWETLAAQEAGHRVRRELVASTSAPTTNMTRGDSL